MTATAVLAMALALLLPAIEPAPLPPPPAAIADPGFVRAVEEWVAVEHLGTIPEPFAGLIDRLGDGCYGCREIATRKLRRLSADDPRWLFWGRFHRDPEVRRRCELVLRKLIPCRTCLGTGRISRYFVWDAEFDRGHYEDGCTQCMGTGTAWR